MANEKKIPNPFEGLDPVGGSGAASPSPAASSSAPNPFSGLDDVPAPSRGYGIGDFARDVGVTAAKGVIGVGEGVVGLANIPTLGRAGKALSSVGYDPKAARQQLDSYRSDALNEQQGNVDAVDGFTDTAKAYLANPGALAATAGESLPSMFAGGAVAKGVMKAAPTISRGIAAGIGEGAISGGQTAEQIRQETASGDLTLGQTAIAAGSGALTGTLGAAAGNLSRRLGIADVDELIAGAPSVPSASGKGIARRIGEGALTEGVIEELPQSVQEQVAQNLALDRQWDEGVGKAAAAGAILGGVMGAGGNAVAGIRSRNGAPVPTDVPPEAAGSPVPPVAGPLPQEASAMEGRGFSSEDAIPDAEPEAPAGPAAAAPSASQPVPSRAIEPEEDIFGDMATGPAVEAPAAIAEAQEPPIPAPASDATLADVEAPAAIEPAQAATGPAEAQTQPAGPAEGAVRVNGQDFILTPEQRQAWAAADENHSRSLAGLLPEVYPRSTIEKAKKAAGLRLSAERRRITGALTDKERQAEAVKAARIRPGDAVQARVGDQDVSGTVEKLRFGRVRIDTNSERGIVDVPYADVIKPQAAPQPAAPEPAVQAIPPNVQAGSSVDLASGTVTIANAVAGTSVTLDPTAGPMSSAAVSAELANGSISRAQQQAAAAVQQQAPVEPVGPAFYADGASARAEAARMEQTSGERHFAVPTVDDQGNSGFSAAPASEAAQVYGKDPVVDHNAVMELAAAKDATPQMLTRLGESGANLNAIGESGRTPLTAAIEAGDTKAAARLARAGADLEAVDGNGFTALQLALATNNNTLAAALVRQGASLDRVVSMARRDAEGKLPKPVQSLVDQAAMRDMFTPGAAQNAAAAVATPASGDATRLESAGAQPTTSQAPQTISREELASRIETIFNGVKPGLGTDLLKLTDFTLETAAEIGGIGPRTYGVSETQGSVSRVRIAFDNIPADWSDQRIKGLVLHEVGVHAAQLGKSKSEFEAIERRMVELLRSGDKRATAAFKAVPENTNPLHVYEEMLAYYVEQNPKSSIAERVVEWFRQSLRMLTRGMKISETGRFNKWVNELTSTELLNMATDALVGHVDYGAKRQDGDVSSRSSGERLFSEGAADPAPAADRTAGVDAAAETTKRTKAKVKYVDKFTTMRKLVRDVEKGLGKSIPDELNPSLAQDKAASIAGDESRRFNEKHVEPLLEFLKEQKIPLETLSDYMQARHAPERNAEMKRINPNRANNEALSGMSNEQSAQILGVDIAGLSRDAAMQRLDELHPALQRASAMVEGIIEDNRRRQVAAGIETKKTVDSWDGKYDFYVPLKREGYDDILRGNGPSQGTGGSLTREASGSSRPVENVIAHAINDTVKTIKRAADNDALVVMAAFTKRYLKKDVARLVKPTQIEGHITSPAEGDTTEYGLPQKPAFRTDEDGNIVEALLQDDPYFADKPNFVAYRVDGKDYAIEFNQDSPLARTIAAAYTGVNDFKADAEVIKMISKFTRYISQINTSLNPFFGIKNIIRDTGHAAIAIENTPLAGKQAQLLRNQALGTRAVFAELSGSKRSSAASQALRAEFNRFRELGGKMDFSRIYGNAEDQIHALKKQLDKDWFLDNAAGRGLEKVMLDKPLSAFVDKVGRPLAAGLEIWNEALENGTRFAIYKTARENGVSEAQAISLAQNLTVNFGRKGTDTTLFTSFYGFFNAAIQGTTSVGRTIFDTDKTGPYGMPFSLTPAGKKILVGGILAGVAQAALMAAAGFDDDEIRENDASKNLLLPLGDKEYLRIPLPQGYSVLPTMGRQVFNAIVYGKPLDRLAKTIEATTDGFNPIGSGGTLSQTLAPTFLDPFVQLTENKDFAGNQIYRENLSRDDPTPGHTRSKDSATAFSKWGSQALNSLTGGTDYKPGAVSPTPDQIDFFLGTLGGGLFREGLRIGNAAESVATGEELDPGKMPILSGYYSNADSNGAVSARYHEALKTINTHELEVEGRKKDQGDVAGYYADNPHARLIPVAKNVEGQVKKLSQARKKATERGDKERVKELGDQIAQAQRRLIDRFKDEGA
ncbi:LPD38 domain-containing protein [Massilia sp. NP310]|uniref:LPD38 domain-containing protein n=1 Tax=Massilia sp. NP310 TaxID=2861282 RepID=UPI001C62CC3C|nr:LPD38 domain-containing protein [Massilia sp. NP310]QYG04005.1 ankyrin repeat domain-containing protein [Massilia sp. NP310]